MKLPLQLVNQIHLNHVERPTMGFSDEDVYLIKQGYQDKDIVIKCSNRKEVRKEAMILKWLENKMKVPKVYFDIEEDGMYYLVMEMLPGQMGQYGFMQLPTEDMIKLYANEIKKWHSIDYHDFPHVNTLTDKIEHTRYNVKHHLVKEQYFERELQGKTGQEVFDEMMACYPKDFDLVLCHGDVCMPNFMIDNGKVTGWIDVVGCGVNDRYLDIAIALRTLRFNFEWLNKKFDNKDMKLFLDTYGIEKLDKEKVKFYILLDELTNG